MKYFDWIQTWNIKIYFIKIKAFRLTPSSVYGTRKKCLQYMMKKSTEKIFYYVILLNSTEIKAKRFLLKFHEFTNNKFETSIKWNTKVHSLQLGIRDSLKNTKSWKISTTNLHAKLMLPPRPLSPAGGDWLEMEGLLFTLYKYAFKCIKFIMENSVPSSSGYY